ncbi:MAG: DUF2130 domain-containing protein [Acidobacteriaceae bacterium]
MAEGTITCPKCGTEVRLTESLAAPLVAKVSAVYEQKLRAQSAEIDCREQALQARAAKLEIEQGNLDAQVAARLAQRLEAERQKIIADEGERAHQQVQEQLAKQAETLQERDTRLADLNARLKTAQEAEAAFIRKEQELEDARRELTLQIERGVQSGLAEVRLSAKREAEDALELKVRDRENQIGALSKQIDELKRKAEQGSQQAQGEVLELALEQQLRARFPLDLIEPVAKGEFGGDVLHTVRDNTGEACGSILWELKRTRNWQEGWLSKLRSDQRSAGAEMAVIVSQTLPKEVTHFDHLDGVWISSLSCMMPVAVSLRQALLQIAQARRAGEGQETKVQQVYTYLTGPRFKHRVESIVEKFSDMQDDLNRERKMMTKQWAKREEQIRTVIDATAGMYGDLQGIAGKSLGEIDALGNTLLLTAEDFE